MRTYSYVGMSVVTQGASIVFFLALARGVTPGEYGEAMAAVTAALFAAGLLNFGANNFLVREISTGRISPKDLLARVAGRLAYSVVVGAIAGIVISSVTDPGGWRTAFGVAMLTVGAHAAQLALVGPLALRKLVFAGSAQLAEKTTALIFASSVLIFGDVSVFLIPFMLFSGCMVSLMLSLTLVLRHLVVNWVSISNSYSQDSDPFLTGVVNPWRGSSGIGISSVAFSMQQLDVNIVRIVAGPVVAGEYAAVSRWNQPFAMLAGSLGQATLPRLASASNLAAALKISASFWPVHLVVLVFSAVGIATSGPFVRLILGDEYSESAGALAVLFVAIPISFAAQQLYIALVAQRLEDRCVKFVVGSTLLGLTLQAILPPLLGSAGASVSFASTQVALLGSLAGVCLVSINRKEKVNEG